jgi:hypothetical protein
MSERSDYIRHVSGPLEASLRERITKLSARVKELEARTPAPEGEAWTEDAELERDIVKEAFDEGVEHNYSFMDMTRNFYGKLFEDPTWGEATDTGRE